MRYPNITIAKFIDRPNRFIAHVQIGDSVETVHVKNTGRCRELLIPGVDVALVKSDNPSRKTLFDLVAVRKESLGWINIDSQAPNVVVKEWLECGHSAFAAKPYNGISFLKPEFKYGSSRIDFYLECSGGQKVLMEVKGCTLEIDGKGYFPDAPTERGVRHLNELAAACDEGYDCYLAFVIAMPDIDHVYPNIETHPEFGEALRVAEAAGVKVLHLQCNVSSDELVINML